MRHCSRIEFNFGTSPKAASLVSYGIQVLLFDSASPLHRCMCAEFDFSVIPAPEETSIGTVLRCSLPSDLLELFSLHPDTRMVSGILKAEISPKKWLIFLENCFIVYLSLCKTKVLRLPLGM